MKAYREATLWTCDQVDEKIVDGKLDFPECTFADAVVEFSAGIDFVQPDEASSFYTVSEELAAQFWLLAETNHEVFDLCSKICSKNLLADASLPQCLRIFAAQVLCVELRRPTPPHRERERNWLEQIFLWATVNQIAERFGLNPTRNDATRTARSACDAMTEAPTVCGRKTKYSEIKNLMVHSDKKRLREEFLACIRIGSRKNRRGLDPDASAKARASETVRDILRTFPTKEGKSPELP
jgi:hypothetical protein